MGFFNRFKNKQDYSLPRGAHLLAVKSVNPLSEEAVQIEFDVPTELQDKFLFKPGQYLNLALDINGEKIRRSYSICSGTQQGLCIGVKALKNGRASSYLQQISVGTNLVVFEPEGSFIWNPEHKNVLAIAAGSGITPILSMLKTAGNRANFHLLYGNKSEQTALFLEELKALENTSVQLYYSRQSHPDAISGRIDEEQLKKVLKENLQLLQADAFFLCGPLAMVEPAEKTLQFFGVNPSKIHKELFFVEQNNEVKLDGKQFSAKSNVKVMIDGEIASFQMQGQEKSILELAEKAGLDAPFSCRGGVCCSCRAKVLKGSAAMRINHSLTESEVAQGYVLTCQAYATSSELILSYDE